MLQFPANHLFSWVERDTSTETQGQLVGVWEKVIGATSHMAS